MKKEEQIRMLLHPEDYTDEQLDQMLDEMDVKVPDANEAWEKFSGKRKEESGKRNVESGKRNVESGKRLPLLKIAAMFVGVLMLSGIAYAAVQIIRSQESGVRSQETIVSTNTQHLSPNTQAPADSTQMKPIVYEDAELATILNEIATFHQCEVVYKSEASKHIRLYFTWDQKATIDDIIDTFNKFERIHITRDNKKLIVE
jgi:cytoskeletal protein RodZ